MATPNPISSASYIIYQIGSNIYAVNGTTRTVDYSSTNNDAYPVIQGAINILWNTGGPTQGGLIHIKAGQYNLSTGLIVPGDWNKPHYIIEGEGQDQTILNNLSTNDAITVYTEQSTIKDLTINGTANSGNGLRCDSDWTNRYGGGGHGGLNTFLNLGIKNNNNGVYYHFEPDHNILSNCTITNNRNHGIFFQGDTFNGQFYDVAAETISQCYISENGGDGIHNSGNTNSIYNCEITSNGGYGIYIDNISTIITNVTCNLNNKGGIYGDQGCANTVIFGQNIQSVNFYLGYCTVSPGSNDCTGYNKWYKV